MEHATAHPNAEFVLNAYQAMTTGDVEWINAHSADDIVFQQVGRSPVAGTWRGRDQMIGHFMAFHELTGGEFFYSPQAVFADGDRAVVLMQSTVGRNGRQLVYDAVHLWRIVDERAVEIKVLPEDPYLLDEFFA